MPTFQPSQWSETTASTPRVIPSYSLQSNAAGEVMDEMMQSLPINAPALPSEDQRKKWMYLGLGASILLGGFLFFRSKRKRKDEEGEDDREEHTEKGKDQTEATIEAASEEWTGSMD